MVDGRGDADRTRLHQRGIRVTADGGRCGALGDRRSRTPDRMRCAWRPGHLEAEGNRTGDQYNREADERPAAAMWTTRFEQLIRITASLQRTRHRSAVSTFTARSVNERASGVRLDPRTPLRPETGLRQSRQSQWFDPSNLVRPDDQPWRG